jgi:mono/diheme cytochrome c family protein
MMKSWKLSIAVGSVLALGLLRAAADDGLDVSKLPPASSQTGVTYDKDIKPIFDKNCIECHGGQKPAHKLSLESLAGAMKPGKEGPYIVAGDLSKSPLLFAVAHVGDPDDFMPPPKNKKTHKDLLPLTKDQVGLIRAWIEQGAK